MLGRVLSRGMSQLPNKELTFYEYKRALLPDEYAGLTVTVFGCTGLVGYYVGHALGKLGADLVFPHDHWYPFTDNVRMLKVTAPIKRAYVHPKMDYNDQDLIERMIRHSDVVVNLLGPRHWLKYYSDFELVNIKFAQRIALACKRNPRVKRLIHFSAAAASPDSPSYDYKSKHFGEKEVSSVYPDATIFKPCPIYGVKDRFINSFISQHLQCMGRNVVFSDLEAVKQPVEVRDVALAVKNAIRLEQAKGKTYYLGGPYAHGFKELLEIAYNQYNFQPKMLNFPKSVAMAYAEHRLGYGWAYLNRERIVKEELDEVVPSGVNSLKELMVQPVSFKQGIAELYTDYEDFTPGIKDDNLLS